MKHRLFIWFCLAEFFLSLFNWGDGKFLAAILTAIYAAVYALLGIFLAVSDIGARLAENDKEAA